MTNRQREHFEIISPFPDNTWLFDNVERADVTLSIQGNERVFHLNEIILCQCSPTFRRVLSGQACPYATYDCATRHITWIAADTMDERAMEKCLLFAYGRPLTLFQNENHEVVSSLANQLDIHIEIAIEENDNENKKNAVSVLLKGVIEIGGRLLSSGVQHIIGEHTTGGKKYIASTLASICIEGAKECALQKLTSKEISVGEVGRKCLCEGGKTLLHSVSSDYSESCGPAGKIVVEGLTDGTCELFDQLKAGKGIDIERIIAIGGFGAGRQAVKWCIPKEYKKTRMVGKATFSGLENVYWVRREIGTGHWRLVGIVALGTFAESLCSQVWKDRKKLKKRAMHKPDPLNQAPAKKRPRV